MDPETADSAPSPDADDHTDDPAEEQPEPGRRRLATPALATPAVAGAAVFILAGLAVRVFVLTRSLGVLDADEATTGLVARHFADFLDNREHPVFYWSSNYGGTIEAIVTAAAFVVFGSSVIVLKAVAIAWYAVACVLAWRVGIRLLGARAGAVAALLMWVWPAPYLWWSTKSRGFYGALLVFGLVMLLTALRVAEKPHRPLDWIAFGFAAGLGWWTGPQIAVIAVPAALWILAHNWRAITKAWMAVPAALLGASPWIVWNATNDFGSFDVPPQPLNAPYTERFTGFWTEGLPMALGLRTPYSKAWIESFAEIAYPLLVAAAAVAVVARYRRTGLLLVGTVVLYSVLYALNPLTVGSQDGRYVFLLAPVIAFVIGACITWRPLAVPAAALTAAVVLSGLGLSAMKDGNSFYSSDRVVPLDIDPVVRIMDEHGVTTGIADYAIAYRVNFETDERLTVVGFPYNRYQPYDEMVRKSPTPAWIFVTGSAHDKEFKAKLDAAGVQYEHEARGGFSVYLPSRFLFPGDPALA